MKRFEILKLESGVLPYALLDVEMNDIICWSDNLKEIKRARDDYNTFLEQDRILAEHFSKLGL